uniref:Zinc finger C2HC domain-containing protein 1A n=1 Tax=Salmo trutta TaxID=8032 RepID=A0A674A014_SALTR
RTDVEEALHSNGELIPCKIYGRTFYTTVLGRHKHTDLSPAKTRKMFDYGKQRAEGTEIYIFKPVKPKPEPSKKQSNWRRKHEDFIATIRATKGNTTLISSSTPPRPSDYYVQCPSCQRRFSENAADTLNYCVAQHRTVWVCAHMHSPQFKPPAPGKKANSPAVSYSSSCLPQRSGLAQHSGIPSIKVTSAGSVRSTPSGYSPNCTAVSGLTSPPLGLVHTHTHTHTHNVHTIREADSSNSRNDAKRDNDVDNGGMMTMFCHECVSKYPVDWAKF